MTKSVKVQKTPRPALPTFVDYKNMELLRSYLTVLGRIVPRYYSGVSLKQQKQLSRAIKQAREMSLIPYTSKY
jgi:small subunit ribosomal protein S18